MSYPVLAGKNKELLENSDESMIVCMSGYDAICIDVNEKYCELLGYSREELINKSTHHLVVNDEQAKVFEKHASLNEKITTWDKLNLIRKDGEKLSIIASSIPLYDEQNNLIAYAHIVKRLDSIIQTPKQHPNTVTHCTNCSAGYPQEYGKCPSCGLIS